MRLATPLGLLGIIGILLLILIYILKPKFQERSISSTFVWKLSLKYKKRKMPFQWLKSSLLVITQFIILSMLAFSLTTPLIELDTKSGEKIIILDASANMLAESNGKTRFERAIQEIGALADSTTPDHRFTVILAGQEASFVARRLDSAKYIKQLLSELEGMYVDADIDAAVNLTEGVLAENPEAEIILFTGNNYSETGAIQVRDMSNDEWNVSILDFYAELEEGYYEFTTHIASFNKDENITVSLYVDGEYRDVQTVQCNDNQEVIIKWEDLYVLNYTEAEVMVEYEDDFMYDNNFSIYGWENEKFTVQIVSENPRFLQAAMLTLGNYKIDIPVAPDDQTPAPIEYEGYDLYIFDRVEPEIMPVDGSVWLIDPIAIPGETELTLGATIAGDFTLSVAQDLNEKEQEIIDFMVPADITLSEYTYVSNYDSYTPVLLNNQDPILLTKDNNGHKLVLFAFSLHQSNLPIIPDYILLTYNLSQYSVQNTVEHFLYQPGDSIDIHKKSAATSMTITIGEIVESYDQFPVTIIASEPGEYSVTQTMVFGEEVTVDFFVRIAENQSNFDYDYGVLSDPIIPNTGGSEDTEQDTIDIMPYLMGALLLLMIIEWGLHYNEHN